MRGAQAQCTVGLTVIHTQQAAAPGWRACRSGRWHRRTHSCSAAGSRAWLARLPPGAAHTLAAAACLDYAAGDFAAALDGFEAAVGAAGARPDIAYGAAACHFRLGDLGAASQLAAGAHIWSALCTFPYLRLRRDHLSGPGGCGSEM